MRRSRSSSPAAGTASRSLAPLIGVGLVAAGALAAALTWSGKASHPGLPDAGALVRAWLPAVRTASEFAALLVVGALLAAVMFVPAGVDRDRSVAFAGRVAECWCVLALLMVIFTVADSLGVSVFGALRLDVLLPAIGRLPVAIAWLVVAHVAALISLAARFAVAPVVLLVSSLICVAAVALTGHSSSGGSHDVASDSLMLHVGAMSLWVGGLAVILVIAGARRDYAPIAARRFSGIALGCWVVVVITGVVNASLRLSFADLSSRYGVLILAKVFAVLVLGGFGYLHRQRTLAQLDDGRPRSLLKFGAIELLIMLLTIGLAVGLSRTAGPVGERGRLSTTEVLIGYPLPNPPSVIGWRFDLIFGSVAVLAVAWYVLKLGRRTEPWPVERTVSWISGCALLFVATCGGLGEFQPAVFSYQVGLHLVVGLVVPAFLVAGHPLAMAGHSITPRPVLAATAALAAPVVLYGFGVFDALVGQHWARLATLAWSLAAGLALLHRPRHSAVLAVAFGHALVGIALVTRDTVLGRSFYSKLAVDWPRDLLANQQQAGWIMVTAAVILAVFVGLNRPDLLRSAHGEVLRRASGQPPAPVDHPDRRPAAL